MLIEKIFSLKLENERRAQSRRVLAYSGKVDVPSPIGDFRVDVGYADGETRNDVPEVLLDEVLFNENERSRVHGGRGRRIGRLEIRRRSERSPVAQIGVDEIIGEHVPLVSRIFRGKSREGLKVFFAFFLEGDARVAERFVFLSTGIEYDVADEISFVGNELEREFAPADGSFDFEISVLGYVVLDLQRIGFESVEFGKIFPDFGFGGVFLAE